MLLIKKTIPTLAMTGLSGLVLALMTPATFASSQTTQPTGTALETIQAAIASSTSGLSSELNAMAEQNSTTEPSCAIF